MNEIRLLWVVWICLWFHSCLCMLFVQISIPVSRFHFPVCLSSCLHTHKYSGLVFLWSACFTPGLYALCPHNVHTTGIIYSSLFTCMYYAHCTVESAGGNEGETWERTSFIGGKQQTVPLSVYSCLVNPTHSEYRNIRIWCNLIMCHSMSNQHKKNPYPHRFEQNLALTQCLLRYLTTVSFSILWCTVQVLESANILIVQRILAYIWRIFSLNQSLHLKVLTKCYMNKSCHCNHFVIVY